MHIARYLDYIQDIDLFIKKEVESIDVFVNEGGTEMYYNSLKSKQKIMHKVVLEHSKIRQSNKEKLRSC